MAWYEETQRENQNLDFYHNIKCACIFSGSEELFTHKQSLWIHQYRNLKIFNSIDIANHCFFCDQIQFAFKEWVLYGKYNKLKRQLGI